MRLFCAKTVETSNTKGLLKPFASAENSYTFAPLIKISAFSDADFSR